MIAGRPLEFDPVIALETAMQVFWRKGYESSSLQDLLTAMGLSKSSFYQAFKSKHVLFQRCIHHYRQFLTDEMNTQLDQTGSGKTFIENLFHGIAAETTGSDARRGCLLMNTANEFAQSDAEIAQLVSDSIDELTNIFETAIVQAQQQGEIPADKDARTLASYLLSSISGLRNMVKAGADRETIKRIAGIILAALD